MSNFKNPWEITDEQLANPWEAGKGRSVLDREEGLIGNKVDQPNPHDSNIAYFLVQEDKNKKEDFKENKTNTRFPLPKNYMESLCEKVNKIYNANNIVKIKFTTDIGKYARCPMYLSGNIYLGFGYTYPGNTSSFSSSYIKLAQSAAHDISLEDAAFTIAHESLHQILMRLGYLLFDNYDYFQPTEHHLNTTQNLNTDGTKIKSVYRPPKVISPLQINYVKNYVTYLNLQHPSMKVTLSAKTDIEIAKKRLDEIRSDVSISDEKHKNSTKNILNDKLHQFNFKKFK